MCLRCVSWADGIDNALVEDALNDTFNQWMTVFLQVIQSDAKKFFDLKRHALKCLTVIFRDFINYSRECINMILQPSWKLLNKHLPIFTEVQGYGKQLHQLQVAATGGKTAETDQKDNADTDMRGFESDEDDEIDEPSGIKGMTLQLIELLTTLVQRPNVQEVVRQGVIPLLMTISSYMIVEVADEREYLFDPNIFLHDRTESVFKLRNIKNQCVDLFSSLIECFGDLAVQSILQIIQNLLDKKLIPEVD